MYSNVSMKVVFAEPVVLPQLLEGISPLPAFWHGFGGLPFGRALHRLNPLPDLPGHGVAKLTRKAKALGECSAFLIADRNWETNDKSI